MLAAFVFVFATAMTVSQEAAAEDNGDWFARAFTSGGSSGGSRRGKASWGKPSKLGGPVSEGRSRRRSKGVEVASLGDFAPSIKPRKGRSLGKSLSGGGGIRWAASSSCLSGSLASTIAAVASNYGSVTVNSTCRSHAHNARVGGAPKSYHLQGEAADFRVHGNWSGAYAYLRSNHGGGLKHYGGGLFHIDTGPRRSW